MVLCSQVVDLLEELRNIQVVDTAHVAVPVEEAVQILHHAVPVRLGCRCAKAHDGIGERFRIISDDRKHKGLDDTDIPVREAAQHTKVDPDRFAMADHNVALVRIRMESSDVQDLVNIVLNDIPADFVYIISFLDDAVLLGNGVAVYIGHRKHALRGQFLDDFGAGDLFMVLDTVLPEELRVFRFSTEIQLFLGHLLEFLYHFDQVYRILVVI